jgi:hypothetical protein
MRDGAHTARCGMVLAFAALSLCGCSILLDTSEQQCSSDSDCAARGGRFTDTICSKNVCVARSDPATTATTSGGGGSGGTGTGGGGGGDVDSGDEGASTDPVWGCLGHVTMEMPRSSTANVSLPFFDLIRMVPITDVGVLVCNRLDVDCSRPIDSQITPADSNGVARFTVPPYFNGYGIIYDLQQPDGGYPATDADDGGEAGPSPTAGRFIPSVVFFNPPIVNDTAYGIVPLFTRADIDALAQVQMHSWDDQNYGMLFAGMLDCGRKPAAGVTWDASIYDSMKTHQFFYVNGFPDESATATDATGFGGLINSRTGSVTITAKVQATGKMIGAATLLVRPGWASYTYLAPTP